MARWTSGSTPKLTISGATTVSEGTQYTLNLSSTGTGGDTITKWTITWGDGSAAQDITGDPATATHTTIAAIFAIRIPLRRKTRQGGSPATMIRRNGGMFHHDRLSGG